MSQIMNINCRRLCIIALLALVAAIPASSQQSAADIQEMLEDRDREIKSLLGKSDNISAEQKEQLRAVINDVIDFHAMGQASLGRHWNRLSNEQQGEFIDVFSKIVRSQSLADLDVFRSSVAYDVITVTGEEAHVFTTTIYKHVPTSVEYELRYDEGRWLAIDIILDEVSTVKGYSRSFQSIIRKKGFDELMKRLRKKLNETA